MKTAKRSMTRTIGPLEMRADIAPDSLNEEARTVDLTWSTGAQVERFSWKRWETYLEELSMDPAHVRMGRLESGAPLLDAHNSWDNSSVIGVVESASLTKTEGRATVRFAKDEASDLIFQKVKDRILRNVSVGYRVHRTELIEDDSDSMPVYRATDWEPFEISMVPMGADAGAGVRSQPETNLCEFVNTLAEEQRTMPDKPITTPSAPVAATPDAATTEATRAAEAEVKKRAKAEERSRLSMIERTAKTLGLDPEFVRGHIDAETPPDKFRELAMEAFSQRKSPVDEGARPSISPGEDQRDKWRQGASDLIVTRAAMADTVSKDEKQRGIEHKIDPGEFRGLSMVDLARQSLEMAGVDTRGMTRMNLVGKAFTYRSQQSTSDFPVLLENTLHRVLLAAWGITPDTWRQFCAVGSVTDFREHKRLRAGTFGALDTVAEGGEFTNKAIDDARKESLTASTKGNLVMLTRQAIINDDLSVFNRVMSDLGRAAKLSIEVDVYALLAENSGFGPDMTDGNPMFHSASHDNVGAGNTITVASIEKERVIMASQKDESGNDFLDLRPKVLLIAIGLGGTARQINEAQFDIDTAGDRAPNIVNGLFDIIVDTPRLSGTRHYLFADPSIAPVIEVAFLDGQEEPFMESRQEWEVDGTSWKVREDYAVGGIGFRGALTDAGA